MALACCCILFISFLIAGICDATEYNILDTMASKHEQWMSDYGRAYDNETEKARRFEIFQENVKHIEDFNGAGEHRYRLGLGPFTDLTTEEFVATYTGAVKPPEVEIEAEEPRRFLEYEGQESLKVESSFDWRTKGAVSPVKYQGQCRSCWSFGVTATVESLTYIKKGIMYDLSEQQLIDCDPNNFGCMGGWPGIAYEYIVRRQGLTTEAIYPFTGGKGLCNYAKARQAVADISGYNYVTRNDEGALLQAVRQQPVAVVLDADNFQHYHSGVFHGPCAYKQTHVVVVVGYGEADDGTKYWIVKNSWSDKWGEAGYIRMERDFSVKAGLCGIAQLASYPTA